MKVEDIKLDIYGMFLQNERYEAIKRAFQFLREKCELENIDLAEYRIVVTLKKDEFVEGC